MNDKITECIPSSPNIRSLRESSFYQLFPGLSNMLKVCLLNDFSIKMNKNF